MKVLRVPQDIYLCRVCKSVLAASTIDFNTLSATLTCETTGCDNKGRGIFVQVAEVDMPEVPTVLLSA